MRIHALVGLANFTVLLRSLICCFRARGRISGLPAREGVARPGGITDDELLMFVPGRLLAGVVVESVDTS